MSFLIFITLVYAAYLLYMLNDNLVKFGENFNDWVIDQLESEVNEPEYVMTVNSAVGETVQETFDRHAQNRITREG